MRNPLCQAIKVRLPLNNPRLLSDKRGLLSNAERKLRHFSMLLCLQSGTRMTCPIHLHESARSSVWIAQLKRLLLSKRHRCLAETIPIFCRNNTDVFRLPARTNFAKDLSHLSHHLSHDNVLSVNQLHGIRDRLTDIYTKNFYGVFEFLWTAVRK